MDVSVVTDGTDNHGHSVAIKSVTRPGLPLRNSILRWSGQILLCHIDSLLYHDAIFRRHNYRVWHDVLNVCSTRLWHFRHVGVRQKLYEWKNLSGILRWLLGGFWSRVSWVFPIFHDRKYMHAILCRKLLVTCKVLCRNRKKLSK